MKYVTKDIALSLIEHYLGKTTREIYNDFYKDQSDETITLSISEILTEILGSDQAKAVLDRY